MDPILLGTEPLQIQLSARAKFSGKGVELVCPEKGDDGSRKQAEPRHRHIFSIKGRHGWCTRFMHCGVQLMHGLTNLSSPSNSWVISD